MNDTVTVDIPYESLDPLTIGSCDDPSSVYREQLILEIPRRNLWAWLKPNEPPALSDVTAAAATALERPAGGPRFSELIGPDRSLAIIIDNQFRPTPASKLLPAVFRRGGAPRGARRARRLRQRQGVSDVGARHRDEARARKPRPDAATRHPFLPERRPAQRRPLHVQGRLLARYPGVGAQRGREVRRADRHRPGAVEPLGLRGRREADPPGGVLRRDHRVEPRRLRAVAPDALRRDGGSDAGRHRRGGDDVRPHLHAELGARYEGRGVLPQLRRSSGGPPRGGAGVQRRLRLPPPAPRSGRHRGVRGVRPHRPPLLPHRVGVHVRRPGAEGRRRHDLLLPEPGGRDQARHLSGPRPVRPHEAPTCRRRRGTWSGCTATSTTARSRCGRAASGRRSTRSCPASI